MPLPSSFESDVRRIGEQLARLSDGLAPSIFNSRWWSQSIINLAMKDSHFKAQLFRFIDVLPAVTDDARVVTLAQEYLGDESAQLFGAGWGLKAAAATGIGARLTGKAIRSQVEQLARAFIAGATAEEALPALTELWKAGRAWSVDLLGEATVSEREADCSRDHCLNALTSLGQGTKGWPSMPLLQQDQFGAIPTVQLSVKVSALSSIIDPIDPEGSYQTVAMRLRPLLDRAMEVPASIIFDMEQAETKNFLLFIFTKLLSEPAYRSYPHGGVALQAYHRETGQDVTRLLEWVRDRGAPITIRLVKGAYWDSDIIRYRQRGWPVPLFEQKAETDVNYEALVRSLLQQTSLVKAAFGTHNLRTLAFIEATAASLGLNPEAWEYQMIYGMAEPFQQAITKMGRRLRLYTPVGQLLPGMAYLVRRLLENTSNESFLRKEYVESQSLHTLLAPPVVVHPVRHGESATAFVNEPHSDFSRESARSAMREALALVRNKSGGDITPHAAGLSVTGPLVPSRNPAHPDHVVGLVQTALPADVDAVVRRLSAAWGTWRDSRVEQRVAVLRHAARLMRERRYELAAWEVYETAKPWREADADVAEAIDFLEFYADEMQRLPQAATLSQAPGELNQRFYAPRGVTAVIAPWNFPLAIPTGMVSAALVTGNPVVFKPSERSSVLGCLLTALLLDAGLPKGLLACLPGGPEVGKALVGHPEIATIAFTGSKDAGLWILREVSSDSARRRHVTKVIAEMGGKNAIIVDETADLDEAVTGVVASFTGYAGQKCSACSRVIVHAAIYQPFLDRLADAVRSLPIGMPEEPGTKLGPVIDERAQAKIQEAIGYGKREARLIIERSVPLPGPFVGPVIFADVLPQHRLAQEEIFGPVLAGMKADSFEDAVELANATSYALTGGVYSRSPANLELARRRFDVGNLYLNRPITGALVGRQPFGGHRLSGVGAKAGGEHYLEQFMVTRVVSENTLRRGFAPTE